MIINIKDTLTLDDNNQYVVVSKINYDNKIYYCLINNSSNTNLKFCIEENEELVEIVDSELIVKLLPLFIEAAKKEIDD